MIYFAYSIFFDYLINKTVKTLTIEHLFFSQGTNAKKFHVSTFTTKQRCSWQCGSGSCFWRRLQNYMNSHKILASTNLTFQDSMNLID